MDQFIRYYFVYCCYVSNELCHCTYYSGLYCITLCFHQIKKTWCKLGILYTISTFHHSTQICPISDKSWRSCQKFQVHINVTNVINSSLETIKLAKNPEYALIFLIFVNYLFRPKLIVLSGDPSHRPSLIDFGNLITKDLSLMTCVNVIKGYF